MKRRNSTTHKIMATQLKYMYNPAFFEALIPTLLKVIPEFDERAFIYRVFDCQWPDLELRERTRHIARALHRSMPSDFRKAAHLIVSLANTLRGQGEKEQQFQYIFLPEYIAIYGQCDLECSLAALEEITNLVSAEYAIRPFLVHFPNQTLEQLYQWSHSKDENVRRLSSEGCRPRLPWASVLTAYKKDPSPILPILETLKSDASEYVRRSVANNLNDIVKDHPDVVLDLIAGWDTDNPATRWTIKHGCRTLLKNGDKKAFTLHGFDTTNKCEVRTLNHPTKLGIGQDLAFDFIFHNHGRKPNRFRLDFAIDYVTATGRNSRRIFKIGEYTVQPTKPIVVRRKKSFKDLSTRKHFSGLHRLRIYANGIEKVDSDFLLA
jgi:3-methyladenine DNA glycosylase AlkC